MKFCIRQITNVVETNYKYYRDLVKYNFISYYITIAAPQVHQPKKRTQNSWLETDLDSGITLDHGLDSPSSPALSSSPRGKQNGGPYPHFNSPTQIKDSSSPTSRQQANLQSYPQSPQNHISSLSPQLREQIHQHQLKQQLLKDQMQGKGSLIQANVAPLYINTDSRIQGEKE